MQNNIIVYLGFSLCIGLQFKYIMLLLIKLTVSEESPKFQSGTFLEVIYISRNLNIFWSSLIGSILSKFTCL